MALPKNKKLPQKQPVRKPGSRPAGMGKATRDRKGNKKGGGNLMFGAMGGYKGVSKKKASRLASGLIRDEVRDISRERTGIERNTRFQRRVARTDYRRGVEDLDHVFGETGDYLNHLKSQNQAMFGQQSQSAKAANAALQQQLGGTYSGALGDVNSEMERLGITGAANPSQIISDQANSQAVAQQSGANTQSTMGLASQNSDQLAGLLQGMNQGSYTSAIGKNLNARNDALSEILQTRNDAMTEMRGAIRDVRMGRKDLVMQLLNQLQETGWGQYMDQQQLNLQRAQFNFSKKQANKK